MAIAGTVLEQVERNLSQAKARLQRLKNWEAVKQRKLETRRKVILGGALIDLAKRDDAAAAMPYRLVRNLSREQDRTAFVDWALRGRTERTERLPGRLALMLAPARTVALGLRHMPEWMRKRRMVLVDPLPRHCP